MISGKQAYWLSYSGMEILSANRFAGITAEENEYTLVGGTITTLGANVGAGKFNGSNITDVITSTGTDADASRQLKWTLNTPTLQAYDFAPATPKLTMGSAVSSIAADDNFTISAWVYMDAIDERPLFGLNAETDDHWIQFTNATVMGFKGTGAAVPLTHGLTISTGSWQHVVIARASSNTVTVYLNGIAGGSTVSWNEAFEPDAIGTSNNGTRKYFDGRMTHLALWTRAITLAEIQSIYIQGVTFSLIGDDLLDGLQHYWKLNNLTDSTAQNNDLTKNGGTANPTGI